MKPRIAWQILYPIAIAGRCHGDAHAVIDCKAERAHQRSFDVRLTTFEPSLFAATLSNVCQYRPLTYGTVERLT
jgi:hypothetical protein